MRSAHGESAGAGPARRLARARQRHFTLLELLIVLIIIGLVLALILPRVGRLPTGLRVRSATAQFRTAFRDAANRARATGAIVKLTLNTEENLFRLEEIVPPAPVAVADSAAAAPDAARPLKPGSAAAPETARRRYGGPKEYPLPKGLDWHLEHSEADLNGPPYFIFYPNGEAAGTAIELSAGPRRFRLEVDRLTGRPSLTAVQP